MLGIALASGACAMAEPPPLATQQFFLGHHGLVIQREVESFRDLKFQHVVRQEQDFSCGAAALATLLQYYYLDEVGEREILEAMIALGDRDRIRREGFSMLDLQNYARSRGYQTRGYKIGVGLLEQLAIPTITIVNSRGYSHFVVLKGARDGRVYLADPALGHRALPVDQFVEGWPGAVLFVAAQRSAPFAPLDVLEGGRAGPIGMVRELDHLGLRNVQIAFPREF